MCIFQFHLKVWSDLCATLLNNLPKSALPPRAAPFVFKGLGPRLAMSLDHRCCRWLAQIERSELGLLATQELMPGLSVSESSAPTTTRKSGTINKRDSIDKNWIPFDNQTWVAEKNAPARDPKQEANAPDTSNSSYGTIPGDVRHDRNCNSRTCNININDLIGELTRSSYKNSNAEDLQCRGPSRP